MKFIFVAAAYGFIFIIVELIAARMRPPAEITRKLSHIIAGVGAALLPFFLSFQEIALLGALFVPAVFVSMRSNLFKSVHGVKRNTYGELYFPVAIALCALLFPDRMLFTYGVLVVGISDALASLVGQRYARKKKGRGKKKAEGKTVAGSTAFFISATLIGFGVITVFMHPPVVATALWSLTLAGALTYIERLANKGLDNLYVPVAACGLLGFVATFGLLG